MAFILWSRGAVPATVLFLLASLTAAGEKPLTEVRSPNFRVLTSASDHQARRIAREFEQMRQVFAMAFPKMRLTTGRATSNFCS